MFKVIRSYPAPTSLDKKSDYKGEDVIKALQECFYSKCYLCETKNPHDINVEHFIPYSEDNSLKFKWENLYFACSRCNNIKLARKDELIDCCNADTDLSKLIKILPPISPYAESMIVEPLNSDKKTINTAKLLNEIYNSDNTPNKEVTGAFLRNKMFAVIKKVINHMTKYLEEDILEEEKEVILKRIKKLTENEASYSAATKSFVLNDSIFRKLIFEQDTPKTNQ
jgi:hypothetical protein